jgi:hypothetical protein
MVGHYRSMAGVDTPDQSGRVFSFATVVILHPVGWRPGSNDAQLEAKGAAAHRPGAVDTDPPWSWSQRLTSDNRGDGEGRWIPEPGTGR